MKKTLLFAAAAMLAAGPALADDHMTVSKKDAKGKATHVMIEGKEYPVCTSDMSDGCINPREAGLKWGNVPLQRWPGKPASEMGKKSM